MVQPELQLSITAAESVSAGTEAVVDVIVTLDGYDGSDPVDVEVGMSVDGTIVSRQTISLTDQRLLSFTHVFSDGGERQLAVAARAVVGSEQISAAQQTTVTVSGGEDSTESESESETETETGGTQPSPSTTLLEEGGWTELDRTEQQVFERQEGAVTVTGQASTINYANTALRDEIAQKTLGNVETNLSTFFASQINISPPLSSLPRDPDAVLADIKTVTEDELLAKLDARGVTDVSQTGTQTLSNDGGQIADVWAYEGAYSVPDMSFDVGSTTLEITGGSVAVDALLAVWHDETNAFVAGGAYPGENYVNTIEKQLSEAIRTKITIDLGLTPEEYRATLTDLVQTVK